MVKCRERAKVSIQKEGMRTYLEGETTKSRAGLTTVPGVRIKEERKGRVII